MIRISFLFIFVGGTAGFYFGRNVSSTDLCTPSQTGGVKWILKVRQLDYGWEEHTHRALIALAVSKWETNSEETLLMGLRLDSQITKTLLRNNFPLMENSNELALYIHALIATNRNPRNYYGFDLVAELLRKVNSMGQDVHPLLVLALCNSKAVEINHLQLIKNHLLHNDTETIRTAEFKSIALKAFCCAASMDIGTNLFRKEMEDAADCLKMKQGPDGAFFNMYVTSYAVQALIACKSQTKWHKEKALQYIKQNSEIDVNMASAYLAELAFNAHVYPFIKDLYPDLSLVPSPKQRSTYFVQYTIRIGDHPDIYFTVSIRVPGNSNFFQIMQMCADANPLFKFSYYLDEHGNPIIYEISGVPNDAEENMFWRLCRIRNNHNESVKEHTYSPALLLPKKDDSFTHWYRTSNCP